MERRVTVQVENGQYYVWSVDDIKLLRTKHKILGSLFGTEPGAHFQNKQSTLPLILSSCEARLLLDENLCKFVKLKDCDYEGAVKRGRLAILKKLVQRHHADANLKERDDKCKMGLKYTGEDRSQTIKDIPLAQVRLPILKCPNEEYSDYKFVDVICDPFETTDSDKYQVFRDLWMKNLYVTNGMKFGSDFLAYVGDPIIYHSSYAVKIINSLDKSLDIDQHPTLSSYCNINMFQRLCHGTHKIPLLAFVQNDNLHGSSHIIYKTVNQKDVLEIGRREESVLRPFLIPSRMHCPLLEQLER